MKKTFRGFTLIELAIVVFSISVLTGILVPNLQHYIIQAQKATDFANGALIYDSVSLVIASDDDAYYSFYNQNGGSRTAQVPERVEKNIGGETYWVWSKTNKKTTIVTRCSGVDAQQEYYLAKKMDMMYGRQGATSGEWSGLHDPFYNGNNKGKYTLYTWEPVCGNNDGDKVKAMQPAELMKRVKNGTDQGEYFTKMLSEKMEMPVWGDPQADKSKTHLTMRYTGGKAYVQDKTGQDKNRKADVSRDMYAWEWMITVDDNYEPVIYRGNGQTTLIDRVYPSVDYNEALDW